MAHSGPGQYRTDLSTDNMAPVIKNEPMDEPMSRTQEYRKVVKPLIERKRRARINNCLDELKDLMVFALQTEGESIAKLEKADVLELTVKHLRKLKRQQMLAVNPSLDMDRFRAGYTQCATEVSRCLASTGVDVTIGSRLMGHLGNKLNTIENYSTRFVSSPSSSDRGYDSGRDLSPSPSSPPSAAEFWRPF